MIKKPILFDDHTGNVDASTFETNGIGVLSDAISCIVTEELDGVFELKMQYTTAGRWHSELLTRRIIYAMTGDELGMQPFRIYRITRPMNGVYTVYAQHYSYDATGIQVPPFSALNVEEALAKMESLSVPSCPFTLQTDKTTVGTMNITVPRSLRNAIVGEDESLLSTYKGDLLFDHSTIKLLGQRGADRGYSIKYGKNMLDIKQEENIQNLYTGIYPYYYDEISNTYLELDERVLYASGTFGFRRIKSVDFSNNEALANNPNVPYLRVLANAYIANNDIGVPTVSITAKIEQLQQSNGTTAEKLWLGDTVSVYFERLGIDVKARIVKTVYDAMRFKIVEVGIGDVKKRITDTFLSLENTIVEVEKTAGSANRTAARLTITTDENSAIVHAMAQVSNDGTVTGKGEFFIKAINGGGSEAYIGADKIAIQGSTTFSSLFTEGKTTIDGGKITANTVTAEQLNVKELSALGATVGGWTIAGDRIYKAIEGSEISEDSPCGMYSGDQYTHMWDSIVTSGSTSPIRFYAGGSPVDKTCKFAVLDDGSTYIEAALFDSADGASTVQIKDGAVLISYDQGESGTKIPFRMKLAKANASGQIPDVRIDYTSDRWRIFSDLGLSITSGDGRLIGAWAVRQDGLDWGKVLGATRLADALGNSTNAITYSALSTILRNL